MDNPDKTTPSAAPKKPSLWKTKRKEILLGSAIAIGLVFLGAWGIRALMPGHEPVKQTAAASIGLVDMQKVMEAHPDYEKLQTLQKEYKSLDLSLKDTEKLPEMQVEPPAVESKPFDDSVWQKDAQTVIGGRTELEREAKKVEKAYREAHEAEYESRRKAVDEDYQNAILNLNIKIDNQKAMHHPWTKQQDLDEERAGWENQRALLQEERGMRQQELAKAWEREVNDYVQSVMGPKLAAWREKADSALPITKGARDMLSTPPAIIRVVSPDLMERAARPTASMPEPHRRFTVVPGTSMGRPASRPDMRATLRLSSPAWLALP